MVPMQDLLALGSEARLNTPGTVVGNWSWCLADGALQPDLAARWLARNRAAHRCD